MSDKLRISLYTLVLYASTFAVGLIAAWRHAVIPTLTVVAPVEFTAANGLVFISVFILFTTVMVRFRRVAAVSLSVFLLLALLVGTQFIAGSWAAWPYNIVIAIVLVIIVRAVPIVATHDIAIMSGIAGIASMLGLAITPLVAAVLLAALSLYDIVSVYRTRHMVVLAQQMITSGSVFGFLVPARFSGFFMSRRAALDARSVMLLGSGDIGLPLVLAASAVSQSIAAAILVSVFALAGPMLMHWLFTHQERPLPMAALPPIAMSAILGYVVAVILGV